MRYSHGFSVLRKPKYVLKISSVVLLFCILTVFVFGFSQVNAQNFLTGFLLSLERVLISYFIAFILSFIVSLLIVSSKTMESIFMPVLDTLQSFPSFSVLPLLIVWFGRSTLVTVIILVLAMLWPILFTLISSLKQRRQDLDEAAVVFGATRFKKLRFVTLPLLFPATITGSLVAWGEAWETVLGAEIIIQIQGVGTYLYSQGQNENSRFLIVGIVLLLTLLFLINKFVWVPLINKSTEYQTE